MQRNLGIERIRHIMKVLGEPTLPMMKIKKLMEDEEMAIDGGYGVFEAKCYVRLQHYVAVILIVQLKNVKKDRGCRFPTVSAMAAEAFPE